jgi:hypothetical protein
MGRKILTERTKLNNKLERLLKDVEEIKIKLAGELPGDPLPEVKA